MSKYIIFQINQEKDLYEFTQTFFNKNYRYSIAMASYDSLIDENENVIYSTIKVAKFNTIPLECPYFTNNCIHRLILKSFVLTIQDDDYEIIDWINNRGYHILNLEEYILITQ